MTIRDKLVKAIQSPTKVVNRIQTELQTKIIGPLGSPWRKGQIVMFHIGRSGSTVLTNLLTQHPDYYWDGEIYESIFYHYRDSGIPADLSISAHDFIKPRLKHAGPKFYGFEVKFFHMDLGNETLAQFMDAMDTLDFQHYIVLKRNNFLRKIVSSRIAHEGEAGSGFHQISQKKRQLRQTAIDINALYLDRETKPLLAFLENYTARFAELDTYMQTRNNLQLTYEDDVETDPKIGYEKICRFTQMPIHPVQVKLGKTNPFPLNKLIINFSEVEQELKNTEFEWMLYA